jgi:hypothetical protein
MTVASLASICTSLRWVHPAYGQERLHSHGYRYDATAGNSASGGWMVGGDIRAAADIESEVIKGTEASPFVLAYRPALCLRDGYC